ncbi:beta-lactamase family protein, partial [bacterium]|nr:beta-lactamase family protein [bacterium]
MKGSRNHLLSGLLLLAQSLGSLTSAQEENTPLPKGYREVGPDKAAALKELCQAAADNGLFSGAVLVAHEGKVIFSEGFGLANREWNIPNTADTKFRLASVSKQFCTMVIMQLV